MASNWSHLTPTLLKKLEDICVPGAEIAFDPDEAEQMGAFLDDATPEQDVIDAAFDEADFDLPSRTRF